MATLGTTLSKICVINNSIMIIKNKMCTSLSLESPQNASISTPHFLYAETSKLLLNIINYYI